MKSVCTTLKIALITSCLISITTVTIITTTVSYYWVLPPGEFNYMLSVRLLIDLS